MRANATDACSGYQHWTLPDPVPVIRPADSDARGIARVRKMRYLPPVDPSLPAESQEPEVTLQEFLDNEVWRLTVPLEIGAFFGPYRGGKADQARDFSRNR